jgi:hypothetical protein
MSHDGPTQPPAQDTPPVRLIAQALLPREAAVPRTDHLFAVEPHQTLLADALAANALARRLAVVVTVQHFVHRTETFAGQALLVVYRQLAGSRLHCRHRESFFRAENGGQCALASHVDQFREAVVYVHGVLAAGYVQLTRINLGEGDEWRRFRWWGCVPATG